MASVLVEDTVPASTLVILLSVLLVPCLALNAVPSHSRASCFRSYNCEPLTASLLEAETAPSATLVILLLVLLVPCLALNAVPSHSKASCFRLYNCEPLTASELVAEIVPSATSVMMFFAEVLLTEPFALKTVWLALYLLLLLSQCNVLLSMLWRASPTLLYWPLCR